jgi:threonyl-tRNA synthetase
MKITLNDGNSRDIPAGQTVGSALSALGLKLGSNILAAKVNGRTVDLSSSLTEDAEVTPLQFDSAEGREVYRHSSTHIMAQAVKEVFPSAQLTIGPALEDGFFYDFAFERPFTPEDLEKIETRAKDIIKRALPVKRAELSKQDAVKLFRVTSGHSSS